MQSLSNSFRSRALQLKPFYSKQQRIANLHHKWSDEAQEIRRDLSDPAQGWKALEFKYGVGKSFLRSGQDAVNGDKISFDAYFHQEKRQIKMLIHFGKLTEGPPGHVHGGASSAMGDTAMGICAWYCGMPCVTANLNINYRQKVPTCTTVLIKAKLLEVENKKLRTSYQMTSLDQKQVFTEGTGLFIRVPGLEHKEIMSIIKGKTDW